MSNLLLAPNLEAAQVAFKLKHIMSAKEFLCDEVKIFLLHGAQLHMENYTAQDHDSPSVQMELGEGQSQVIQNFTNWSAEGHS